MSTTFTDDVIVNATGKITSISATALTVAASGTNYGLQVDEATVSAATGLKITAAAAGSGLVLSTISSGANENLKLDAKGTGSVTVGSVSTGNVVLATGGGSVGVGTSSPSRPLEINPGTASDYPIRFSRGGGETTYGEVVSGTEGIGLAARNVTAGSGITFHVSTGTTDDERMRIDSNGNVGIGTAAPVAALDVRSVISIGANAADAGALRFPNNTGIRWRNAASTGNIQVLQVEATDKITLGSDDVTIDTAGNVGIGTSGPTALLDINTDTLRLRTAKTPASSSAAGNQGDFAWDSNYFYICVATNTWRRVAHSTW